MEKEKKWEVNQRGRLEKKGIREELGEKRGIENDLPL